MLSLSMSEKKNMAAHTHGGVYSPGCQNFGIKVVLQFCTYK